MTGMNVFADGRNKEFSDLCAKVKPTPAATDEMTD